MGRFAGIPQRKFCIIACSVAVQVLWRSASYAFSNVLLRRKIQTGNAASPSLSHVTQQVACIRRLNCHSLGPYHFRTQSIQFSRAGIYTTKTSFKRPAVDAKQSFSLFCGKMDCRKHPRVSDAVKRQADVGGGVDYAIIRFKIPGFDDLTMLPRVLAALGTILLVANRIFFPDTVSGQEMRILSETVSLILVASCAVVPYLGRRLEEAARRQVSTRPASKLTGCLQTLAISDNLPQIARLDVSWVTSALLRFTNADGLAVWREDAVICTRGLLQQLPEFSRGTAAVLTRLGAVWKPSVGSCNAFCATRKNFAAFQEGVLPTRVIPGDAESAIVKPLPGGGFLVMWSALPRAFDRAADRQWIEQAAMKLASKLPEPSQVTLSAADTELCLEDELPLFESSRESDAIEMSRDPFSRFDTPIRLSPGTVGLGSLALLGLNRNSLETAIGGSIVGIDPAQSRADLVGGGLAIALVLQSMVWLSETPADPEIEDVASWEGVENIFQISDDFLDNPAVDELRWAWESLSKCTRTSSMVVFWRGSCVMQGGYFRRGDAGGEPPKQGDLCEEVITSGRGRYFAQLNNYPAKVQFISYFPERTQGLVLTPLRPAQNARPQGVVALGIDAIRGVGKIDQAWIGAIAEKLAVSLAQDAR